MIESKKINDFLNSWKDGIIRIGKVYLENGDYKESAEKFHGLNNLILTPHIAGVTEESNIRVSSMIAEAVLEVLS